MKKYTISFFVGIVAVSILGLIMWLDDDSQKTGLAEIRKVKLGHLVALDMMPHFVAKEAGFFMEENLDVTLEAFFDVFKNNQALADGEIDFSINPFTLPYFALQKGIPIRTISSAGGWGVIQLVIQGTYGINSIKELEEYVRLHKDEKIKIGSFKGDTLDLIVYDAIRAEGLSYNDFEMVWYTDLLEMVKAFKENKIGILAHIKPYTTDLIKNNDAIFLTDNAQVWGVNTPNCVLSVLETLIVEEPEVMEAYLRALIKSAQLINTEPHKAIALLENSTYPHYFKVGYDVVLEALRSQPAPISFTPNVKAVNSVMLDMMELKYIDQYIPGRKLFSLATIKHLEQE